MASDTKRRAGWALDAEKLARRVPRFAAFVEGPQSGHGELTEEQREFLDKFSAGLSEAMPERGGGPEAGACGDDKKS